MFGGTLGTPDNTGGGTGGIETGMGTVTFVGATELTVGFGTKFCMTGSDVSWNACNSPRLVACVVEGNGGLCAPHAQG